MAKRIVAVAYCTVATRSSNNILETVIGVIVAVGSTHSLNIIIPIDEMMK